MYYYYCLIYLMSRKVTVFDKLFGINEDYPPP